MLSKRVLGKVIQINAKGLAQGIMQGGVLHDEEKFRTVEDIVYRNA
jgi:hypothetical protein